VVHVGECIPRVAKILDKVTRIRSMHHTMKNHNSASYYALTGHAPPVDDIRLQDTNQLYPAYGSVVDRFAPARGEAHSGMPKFVSFPYVIRDGSITPGQKASFLGKEHDPFIIQRDPSPPPFAPPDPRVTAVPAARTPPP